MKKHGEIFFLCYRASCGIQKNISKGQITPHPLKQFNQRESMLSTNLFFRASLLFSNFLLIITAYYHVKPASRTIFIEFLGTERLPYVWIGSALTLGLMMPFYHKIVSRFTRLQVVMGSCALFSSALVLFYVLLRQPNLFVAIGFYILVDIFSVVLVEQFWSLTNSIYTTSQGKRWYGLVGSGGLVGGIIGGAMASALIRYASFQTIDLLLVAAGILGLLMFLIRGMATWGFYQEVAPHPQKAAQLQTDGRQFWKSRYLLLIVGILLLAQLLEPIVEYQFLKQVEIAYIGRDDRTVFLSTFFSVLGGIALGVNLIITPMVHRFFGVIAGLAVQPLAVIVSAGVFWTHLSLMTGSVLKIADRGLSYSINRASKELLYVPVDPVLIFQAKAWVDMLGYRLFKVLGAFLILALTQWFAFKLSMGQLSGVVMGIALLWLGLLVQVAKEYQRLTKQ